MAKTVVEYLDEVEFMFPDAKNSDRLYIVGLLQNTYEDGYKDAMAKALEIINSGYDGTVKL